MKIAVFGGASLKENDPEYKFAIALGFELGNLGYTVITGGYHGSMQAVSQGAKKAGGTVIGITCREIENLRPVSVNQYVTEEIKADTLVSRIDQMINLCDAAIALPGGIGTLAEITVMWNRLILGSIKKKPLVLLGSAWDKVLQVMRDETQQFVTQSDFEFLMPAKTISETIKNISSNK